MKDKLGSEKIIWDLTHLYQSINDENIKYDIEGIRSKVAVFSTKYRGKLKDLSPAELLYSISELEEISQKITRISSFAYLNFTTQTVMYKP